LAAPAIGNRLYDYTKPALRRFRAKPTKVGLGFWSRRIYSATSPHPNFFLEIHEIGG
jgi:hypothetical protein